MSRPPTLNAAPLGAVRNVAIGLITLAVFAGAAGRYAISPMQELVKADLALGDNQIALLQGMALALPTALMSLPIGRLVDRGNRTSMLIVLALICVVGSALMALAPNLATAVAARMLVCGAVVAAQAASLSLVADLTEPSRRGRMISVISLGQALGATLAYILAGKLLAWLPALMPAIALAPWRQVQLAFAAAVLVSTIPLLFLREPARRESGLTDAGNLGTVLRALWGYRQFLLPLVAGMATVGMADAAASIWAVPVLTRTFHQTPADFGTWMGLLNLGSGIVGVILGGVAADMGQRRRGQAGVLFGAVLAAAVSVPAALFPIMPNVASFGLMLALLLTCGACCNIAATAAIMVVLPNQLRGICISLIVAVIAIVAFGIAPLIVSLTAQQGDIVVPLVWVGFITSVLATIAFFRAMRAAATLSA